MSKKNNLFSQSQFCLPQHVGMINRRNLLRSGVYMTGYMAASQLLGIPKAEAQSYTVQKKLIWISMNGGWDILEVTDPKQSSTSGIDMSYSWDQAQVVANSSDLRIGRWLPGIASLGQELLVVRGVAMGTTSHMAGSVYMDTGVLSNAGTVNAASVPSIVASESSATIPIIQLNGGADPMTDRGLLNPVSVVRAQNLELYRSMFPEVGDETTLRLQILDYLNSSITRLEGNVGTNDRLSALSAAEQKIRGQIESNVASNLTISTEDTQPFMESSIATVSNNMAESFALATKLIANDLVSAVNLGVGGFDTHANQEARLMPNLQSFDHVLSTMVNELSAAGALDDTLIVVYSDFGRTPKINASNGRDHWPVGGVLMLGGGIDGGRAVGSTDDDLLAIGINPTTGAEDTSSSATQIAPSHVAGSVIELCLGNTYDYRTSYLEPLAALTRLRS